MNCRFDSEDDRCKECMEFILSLLDKEFSEIFSLYGVLLLDCIGTGIHGAAMGRGSYGILLPHERDFIMQESSLHSTIRPGRNRLNQYVSHETYTYLSWRFGKYHMTIIQHCLKSSKTESTEASVICLSSK